MVRQRRTAGRGPDEFNGEVMLQRLSLVILSGVLIAGPAFGQGYGMAPRGEQYVEEPVSLDWEPKFGDNVPMDARFRDEDGNDITLGECIDGKPTVLVMAYYRCPKLCSEVLNAVLRSAKGNRLNLGDDYRIITVSFDPKEQPILAKEKKQRYIEEYGRPRASEGWRFLTGDKDQIDILCEAVGFRYEYNSRDKFYVHPSGVVVLTPEGEIARYIKGIEYTNQADNLKFSLIEASQGKINLTFSEQVIHTCMIYNPDAGTYAYNLGRTVLMVAAIPIMLIVGGVVFFAVRSVRREVPLGATQESAKATDQTPTHSE